MATKKKTTKKSVKKTSSKKITLKKTPKKTPEKRSIKKVASKKKISKKQDLVHAPYEHVFWVCDGMVLSNLRDLENALSYMSEEAYKHHANSERNDFASWVRDILREPRLALTLEKSKSKKEALKKIKTKLKDIK